MINTFSILGTLDSSQWSSQYQIKYVTRNLTELKSLIKAKFSFSENLLWHPYIPLVPGSLLLPFTFPLLLLIPLHSSLSLFLLWEIISFWRPIWTTTQYVDRIHPDYVILLPQHLHCWDDRHHKPAITMNLSHNEFQGWKSWGKADQGLCITT